MPASNVIQGTISDHKRMLSFAVLLADEDVLAAIRMVGGTSANYFDICHQLG